MPASKKTNLRDESRRPKLCEWTGE